jgi:hypothetical protein
MKVPGAPAGRLGDKGTSGQGDGKSTHPLLVSSSPRLVVISNWLARHERQLRGFILLLAAIIFIVQWVRASSLVRDGDFYLHWQFAGRLLHHELLYAEGLHVPYPPFWAMAWLPVTVFPLAAAKVLCYPLSAIALALLFWLLDRLCRDRLPLSGARRFWAAAAALVVVSRFVVRELPECGPNLTLLACVWAAIYFWTQRRDVAAGLCLGLATALKCTPGLFIAYFIWKRQWKLTITSAAAAAAFSLAPALWQGPTDYQRHVQIWLANLRYGIQQPDPSAGVLGPDTLQNLSLRPAVVRCLMHLPEGHPGRLDHPAFMDFLDLSPATAGRITKLVMLALLLVVAWCFRKPIADRDGLTVAWECAAVGTLALLLSPITWYQHCVALLPVFYLFMRTVAAGIRPARWMVAIVVTFVVVVLLLSRGLIGREASLLLASYHLTTWAVVAALVLAVGNRLALNATRRQGDTETRRNSKTPVVSLSPCPLIGQPQVFAQRFPWTASFVTLGIALRLYHYLRNPSLWHDEAALVVNVLEKGFAELLGPLRFSEAAPPLFLWLEKCVVWACGDSLFALRLMPLGASCAALLLFVPVARRILSPAPATWAVLLFAVSDRLLWHACEAKQYSLEVFASVLLLAVWLTTDGWLVWRRALLFCLLAPPLLCLAYPAAFLYGGVLLALLLELATSRGAAFPGRSVTKTAWEGRSTDVGPLRQPRRVGDWLAYGLLCLTVFATFGLLLVGPVHAQRDETIVACWNSMSQFPDWSNPAGVPGWMALSTCGMIGYCIKPVGEWLSPLVAIGVVLFWRQGRRDWCILLATPVLLALIASCLKAYPYGGMRVMSYAAPAIFLCAAGAIPWCLGRFSGRRLWAAGALIALLMVPVVRAGYIVVRPWERADCATAAAYVAAHRQADEIVTANHWEYLYYFRRLGPDFVPIENLGAPRERMWVVVTGALPADRDPCLSLFSAPGWTTLDRQEFDRTTVVLVERISGDSRSGPVARNAARL